MTTLTTASSATPGQRFTDPDGGTWVLVWRHHGELPWWYASADGKSWCWPPQEEAEAAGLVRLEPISEAQARLERNPQAVEAIQQAERDLRDGKAVEIEIPAAPAPLDPGNPEHLRRVREFVLELRATADLTGQKTLGVVALFLADEIVRLEREASEVEREAADRELAHKTAAASKEDFTLLAESYQEEIQRHVLAGIRAERVRAEETKP